MQINIRLFNKKMELSDQGLEEKEIEQILKIEFGLHVYCQKTIYKWFARHKLGFKFDQKGKAPSPSFDEQLLSRIVGIINDEPYSSTRQIAKVLDENRSFKNAKNSNGITL